MIYSGFWKRLAASLIDGLVLLVPSLMISGTIHDIGISIGSGFILGFLYRPFFESSQLMGTPGKALLGIVVATESGEPITFKQACVRFFCSYLSMAILYIGYLMQIFTTKRQTLHDILSETVVIEKQLPDLNYFSVWKVQFKSVIEKL